MRVPVDPAIARNVACQHKNSISICIEPCKTTVSSIQWSGGSLLNPKSEKNIPIGIGGKRRVDEDRVIESVAATGVCDISDQISIEALLHGSGGQIGIRIINVVRGAPGARIVKPRARDGRREDWLIRRDPTICWQDIISSQCVFQ